MALGSIFCNGTTPGVFSTICEITSLIVSASSSPSGTVLVSKNLLEMFIDLIVY